MSADVAIRMRLATTWRARMAGLLGTSAAERSGEWLVLVPCSAIHTLFMRYSIDVAFVDSDWRVLRVAESLAPGVLSCACRGAAAVIERPAGGSGEPWPKIGETLVPSVVHQIIELEEDGGCSA